MYFLSMGKSKGFTLLEVSIALALMAWALVHLIVTHGGTIRHFTRSKELTYAAFLAEERMALIEAQGFGDGESYSESGETDQPPPLGWRENVSAVDDLMLKVEVKVTRSGKEDAEDSKSLITLNTYITSLDFEEKEGEEGEEP